MVLSHGIARQLLTIVFTINALKMFSFNYLFLQEYCNSHTYVIVIHTYYDYLPQNVAKMALT